MNPARDDDNGASLQPDGTMHHRSLVVAGCIIAALAIVVGIVWWAA